MKLVTTLRALKGVFALALTMALVPLASAFHPAEAKPPRHAPAYGYRAKQRNSSNTYRRYQTRRTTTRRTYPTRTYRRYPTRPSTGNYSYNRRTYRTPSGSTRTRTYQRTYRRDR